MRIDTANPLANSNLNRTILRINPGVDRKAENQISNLIKLTKKTSKTSEYRRKAFLNTFESRRTYRQKLYERLRPKLDPSTRVAIDRFKEEQRKKEWEKLKKLEALKQIHHQKTKGGSSFSESVDDKWDQQPSITLDWSSETGPDFSHRSSLKSTIL